MAEESKSQEEEEISDSSSCSDDSVVCPVCGGSPCDWIKYQADILQAYEGMAVADGTPNHLIRKAMYQFYIYMKYGNLGKGNRIPIEQCVVDNIREQWPEPDGDYMGYKSE